MAEAAMLRPRVEWLAEAAILRDTQTREEWYNGALPEISQTPKGRKEWCNGVFKDTQTPEGMVQ